MRVAENFWYPVLESQEVQDRPVGAERLGRKFVFWRTSDGVLRAQRDRCPHMGVPLSPGWVTDDCIVCPLHGYHFDAQGDCQPIQVIGTGSTTPDLTVATFLVREAHGLAWLWWGDPDRADDGNGFFPDLTNGWRYQALTGEWPMNYLRAIELRLDVAGLPTGIRSAVDQPRVQTEGHQIRVWTSRRGSEDTAQHKPGCQATAAGTIEPAMEFRFPGIWLLNSSPAHKHFIAFVPVNENSTRYYYRSYRMGRSTRLNRLSDWLMSRSSRLILKADNGLDIAKASPDGTRTSGEHLETTNPAIMQFRRLHTAMMAEGAPAS